MGTLPRLQPGARTSCGNMSNTPLLGGPGAPPQDTGGPEWQVPNRGDRIALQEGHSRRTQKTAGRASSRRDGRERTSLWPDAWITALARWYPRDINARVSSSLRSMVCMHGVWVRRGSTAAAVCHFLLDELRDLGEATMFDSTADMMAGLGESTASLIGASQGDSPRNASGRYGHRYG